MWEILWSVLRKFPVVLFRIAQSLKKKNTSFKETMNELVLHYMTMNDPMFQD